MASTLNWDAVPAPAPVKPKALNWDAVPGATAPTPPAVPQSRVDRLRSGAAALQTPAAQARAKDEENRTLEGIGSAVGGVVKPAVEGAAYAGGAFQNPLLLLSKQGRKRLKDDAVRTPAALQELAQPFGVFQDVLGGIAQDVQKHGLAGLTEPEYAQESQANAAMGEALHAVADDPKHALRNLAAVNQKRMLFNPPVLDALAKGGGPIGAVADTLAKNPLLAAGASLATESVNPIGGVAGATARGAVRGAGAATRAASDATDLGAEARAARAEAQAGSPGSVHPLRRALDAPVNEIDRVRNAAGRATNIYHDAERSKIPGLLAWRQRQEAMTTTHPRARVDETAKDVFHGLTQEQKIEVAHSRFESNEPNSVARVMRNDPAYVVPEPENGPSLDERAQILREDAASRDARLKAAHPDLLPTESESPFISRKNTKRNPVYKVKPPEIERNARGGGSGGAMGAPKGARGSEARVYPTLLDAVKDGMEIHPKYDPAAKYVEGALPREKDIGATTGMQELEHVPIGQTDEITGLPVNAREGPRFFKDDAAGRQIFGGTGVGDDAEKAARSYAHREGSARAEAALGPKPPRPLAPPQLLRGKVIQARKGANADANDATNIASALQRVNASVKPERFEDILAPQTARTDALGQAVEGNVADRARLKDDATSVSEGARDLEKAAREARAAARNAHATGEGREVDGLVNEIAARRHATPAGTSLKTYVDGAGDTHVLGSSSSFQGSQFTKQEVNDVRIALDRARKASGSSTSNDVAKAEVVMPPRVKATMDEALAHLNDAVGSHGEARAKLEALVKDHNLAQTTTRTDAQGYEREVRLKTPDGSIEPELKRQAKAYRDYAKSLRDERDSRPPLPKEFKGHVADVVKGQARTAKGISDEAAAQAAKVTGATTSAVKRIVRTAVQAKDDVTALTKAYEAARASKAARDAYMAKLTKVTAEIEAKIFKELTHPPQVARGTYGDEADLALGVPRDGAASFIHKDAYRSLAEARNMTPLGDQDDMSALHRFFIAAGHLSRMDIILWPTVHAVWNLGRAFLMEGGNIQKLIGTVDDPIGAEALARVQQVPGHEWATPEMTWGEFGERTGAIDAKRIGSVGLTNRDDATIRTSPFDELGPLGRIDKGITEGPRVPLPPIGKMRGKSVKVLPGMDDNNWLVFHVFERRYGGELLRKFIVDDGMEIGEAVRRVRKALGDHHNVTSKERPLARSGAFMFYSWMKTVIPFWTKMGFFHPNAWQAPITAARQEREGMKDPEADFIPNLWTIDAWQNADHTYERLPFPDPARVLEPVAQAARIPFDMVRGEVGENAYHQPEMHQGFGVIADDAAPMVDYLRGHLNPLVSAPVDAVLPGDRNYQRIVSDPRESLSKQIPEVASSVAGNALPTIGRAAQVFTDPVGAALGAAVGVPPYQSRSLENSPSLAQTNAITKNFGRQIFRATQRGDTDSVQVLRARQELALSIVQKYARDLDAATKQGDASKAAQIRAQMDGELQAVLNAPGAMNSTLRPQSVTPPPVATARPTLDWSAAP